VAESPVFVEAGEAAERRKLPISEVLTRHGRAVIVGIVVATAQFTVSGIMTVWAVSQAVQHSSDQTQVLNAKALSALVLVAATFFAAWLSDRFGRRRIMALGMVGMALFAYPAMLLVQSGSVVEFTVAIVGAHLMQALMYGPLAGFVSELFPTRVRFTGASLGFQGGSTIGAGLSPAAATLLVAAGGAGLLAGLWVAVLLICLVVMTAVPERNRIDLRSLDLPRSGTAEHART
jgi:MHS family shikimate/dehydroshikimate transporter-like MFS transporter